MEISLQTIAHMIAFSTFLAATITIDDDDGIVVAEEKACTRFVCFFRQNEFQSVRHVVQEGDEMNLRTRTNWTPKEI